MSIESKILLAVGSGLEITIPSGVTLLPIAAPVEPGPTIGPLQQQEIVKAALAKPEAGPPLRELALTHRRAVILAGDLSLPAPYDIALPPVMSALVDAGIRPTRIAVLVCPGSGAPILGRGAIHRYGEEIVGDHDLRVWQSGENNSADPLYSTADLRIAVTPGPLPPAFKAEFEVELVLGNKSRIDIVSARAGSENSGFRFSSPQKLRPAMDADVLITSSGGSDWESTLEEALLSLWRGAPASNKEGASAVLAFSGEEGLGSAHFTRDLWALLEQAEEFLAGGGSLAGSTPRPETYDPAAALAHAFSRFAHVILFSPKFSEHSEGEELAERLGALPHMSQRLGLIGSEPDLWALLARWHGPEYRVLASPLGWRG